MMPKNVTSFLFYTYIYLYVFVFLFQAYIRLVCLFMLYRDCVTYYCIYAVCMTGVVICNKITINSRMYINFINVQLNLKCDCLSSQFPFFSWFGTHKHIKGIYEMKQCYSTYFIYNGDIISYVRTTLQDKSFLYLYESISQLLTNSTIQYITHIEKLIEYCAKRHLYQY